MANRGRRARLRQLFAMLLGACAVAGTAAAQSVDAGQLSSIFSGMTAEQQQAVLQQLGGSGAASGAASSQSRQRPAGAATAQPQRSDGRTGLAAGQADLLPSSLQPLKPLDSVLLDVELQEEVQARQQQQLPKTGNQQLDNTGLQGGIVGQGQAVNTPPVAPAKARLEEEELSKRERERLKVIIDQIRRRNPYTLDRNGELLLPGFAPIALAGLNEELATKRVAAEPALLKIEVKVTRLPLAKSGIAALKPFGYDFFEEAPSTFAPMGDVAVPSDYLIGAGDELNVQLYGSQNRTTRLLVQRDGRINFPSLGPIEVAGRTYSAVRNDIEARVARQMIGTRASVSMGESRSIRVFVMGEARYPGTYTVSGLATVTGALFAAGGVKAIGSLRNVQVKRAGKLVRRVDLYDLLLQGDTSGDVNLLSGDVILIPPVGATVTVDGEVRRPAIYELDAGAATAADVIAMAGGLTPDADSGRAVVTRVDEQRRRVAVDIDPLAATSTLRNGDALRVAALRPTLDSGVTLTGEVFRSGVFAWRPDLRLSDIIGSVVELKPNADPHYLLIRREVGPERRVTAMSADLTAALAAPRSPNDVPLTAHDQVIVFDLSASRERLVKPLVDELKLQAGPGAPVRMVTVSGKVKAAGDYPLDVGMHVADLVRAGGGLEDAAYSSKADLSRYSVENGQTVRSEVVEIDLAAALRGDPNANIELKPMDGLFVKEIAGWAEQDQVVLKGEVRYPGTYPIRRGETLRAVLDRAGGLTDLAFPEGSVLTREELKEREQEQLDRLADRLRSDLAAASLMGARANQTGAAQSLTIGQSLLDQLKASKAVGRLVIDLPAILAEPAGGRSDVIVRNGDELIIPKRRQEVTVMGEVQNVTSHVFESGRTRDDYVALSGGTTRQADRKRVYVVRANGSVVPNGSAWMFRAGRQDIRSGDTIVVPFDTERMPPLPLWQSVTQILYNLTVAAAALNSF